MIRRLMVVSVVLLLTGCTNVEDQTKTTNTSPTSIPTETLASKPVPPTIIAEDLEFNGNPIALSQLQGLSFEAAWDWAQASGFNSYVIENDDDVQILQLSQDRVFFVLDKDEIVTRATAR